MTVGVRGVGLQLNDTVVNALGVDGFPGAEFAYAQLICDSWAAPLDSGSIVNPSLRRWFDLVAERYPLLAHSNYGLEYGFDPLADSPALRRHVDLAREMRSPWIADHMFYGLLSDSFVWSTPLQFSRAEIERVAGRAAAFQDALKIPLLHENAFYYATFPGSEIGEAEFMAEVALRAQTHLLLDLHNVHANSIDHEDYDPWRFLATIPLDRVMEIHIAGGQWIEGWYHDLHNDSVPEPVWEMLEHVLHRAPNLQAVTLEFQGAAHHPRSRPLDASWTEMVVADLSRARQLWSSIRGEPDAAPPAAVGSPR